MLQYQPGNIYIYTATMNKQTSQQPDPKELIVRAQAGDDLAFEQLYNQYFTPIARYILIRVGDNDVADDLTQMVFLKFHRNLNNWQDKGYAPSAYLYTIARSVIADYYRKESRTGKKTSNSEDVLALLPDASQNPHQDVIVAEEIENLYIHLHQLPQHYQEVLLLRYVENMSSSDVAHIIGKTDVATRKVVSRAVKALGAQMKINSDSDS